MVIPLVVVSGYLVTHEAKRFKDPLLGTFVPCSVLGKELRAHAMVKVAWRRSPKCKVNLYNLFALQAFHFNNAACRRDFIKEPIPANRAQLGNSNSAVIVHS